MVLLYCQGNDLGMSESECLISHFIDIYGLWEQNPVSWCHLTSGLLNAIADTGGFITLYQHAHLC